MNSTKISIENISPRVTKRKYEKLYELLEHSLSRYDVKSGVLETGFFGSSKFDVLVRFVYPKQEHNEHIKDYVNKTEKTVVKYGTRPTESQALVGIRYHHITHELNVNLSIGEKCKFPNGITDTINEIANAEDWNLLNSISTAPKNEEGLLSRIIKFSNKYNQQ